MHVNVSTNSLGLKIIQVKVGSLLLAQYFDFLRTHTTPLFPGLRVMFEFLEVEREMTSALP